jgi:hypothetical protein
MTDSGDSIRDSCCCLGIFGFKLPIVVKLPIVDGHFYRILMFMVFYTGVSSEMKYWSD